jgi:hypothetical protein
MELFKAEYKNKRYWVTIFACLFITLQAWLLDPQVSVVSIGALAGVCSVFIGGDSYRPSNYDNQENEQ